MELATGKTSAFDTSLCRVRRISSDFFECRTGVPVHCPNALPYGYGRFCYCPERERIAETEPGSPPGGFANPEGRADGGIDLD